MISDKHECDKLIKTMKEQLKNREKMLKAPPPPKKDASGRERYAPEMYVATCEDCKHPETNQPYWLYTRNLALKTLVLEHNPITDAAAVRRLLPYGCGDLVLRTGGAFSLSGIGPRSRPGGIIRRAVRPRLVRWCPKGPKASSTATE